MKHYFTPCKCEMCSTQWSIVRCAICGDFDKECITDPQEEVIEQ